MYLLSRVFQLNHTKVTVNYLFKKAMSTTTKDQPSILKWASNDGEFRRQQSTFRDFIVDDASAKFSAEP